MIISMKFIRTKKLVFLNNKWWVGKTTIAYNTAIKFANKGYKTVLVDLDPQCNLSRLALWEHFDNNLLSWIENNIYGVLKWVIEGGWDVNTGIQFQELREHLSILSWSLNLSLYEDLLSSSFSEAAAWQPLWYFNTSAIYRFLNEKWLNEDVDIFIIDVSPSLGLLNRAILLWSDYFITPLNPDVFSLQWIENLWKTLEKWKLIWKNSAKVMANTRDIPNSRVLNWEWLFIGYIINSYNKREIKSHKEWIEKIPSFIKKYLSEKHCKNWLVESSGKNPLVKIKDYWELPSDWQIKSKAIFELVPWKDFPSVDWTKENLELSKKQFEELITNLINVLEKY
jgi:cellulose biosynthesis protein BcsQ